MLRERSDTLILPAHFWTPCWHCSAGVGRTGTFIAVKTLIEKLHNWDSVDVPLVVRKLRLARNLMVQTEVSELNVESCNLLWEIALSLFTYMIIKNGKLDLPDMYQLRILCVKLTIASNAMTQIQTISCFSVREPGAALSPLAIHFECVQTLVFC